MAMKRLVGIAFLALLFTTSCEKKTPTSPHPILGCWQVTDIFSESEYSGVHHEDLSGEELSYEFRAPDVLITTMIENGDTTVENGSWLLNGDTLYLVQSREPGEEPGMPGVMQIQSLDNQTMRWCYLILGDMYIDLKRINNQ